LSSGALLITAATVLIAIAACLSPLAQSAEPGTPSPASGNSSFGPVSELLDRRCTACHNQAGAAGAADLNLEADQSYAMLLRKSTEAPIAIVTPGDPDKSYLFAKLTGNQKTVGGLGDSMPAGQGRLPPNEIELIRAWIQDGARP
jgi:hypothetical protein